LLWDENGNLIDSSEKILEKLPTPKIFLPGNENSYNPPKEYLDKNSLNISKLREIPSYNDFIKERYLRCLGLINFKFYERFIFNTKI
jgi:hypothetical protein